MSDSPHDSTRFSTPVNELDDHRGQPSSLPRAGEHSSSARRGTVTSLTNEVPTLEVPTLSVPEHIEQGFKSRDFETAVVDDDRSENASVRDASHHRRHSASPVVARRSTFRRPAEERPNLSRASTRSSRSTSPPNSVDAFAEPGVRGRAGTVTSHNTSHVNLHRTVSGGTHRNQRRPSHHNQAHTHTHTHTASDSGSTESVEDDVCFPSEETSKIYTIDFEDLHEFVVEQQSRKVAYDPNRRKHSFSCTSHSIKEAVERRASVVSGEEKHSGDRKHSGGTHADAKSMQDEKHAEDSDGTLFNHNHSHGARGQPLHRWSFFSSELEESIHAADLGDLILPGESFRQLFELGPEGGCWWLDVNMPTDDEVEVLCKAFGVHGLTREDIIEQEAREKVELFKTYYFVCFRSFIQDKKSEDYLDPVNVYAVVFREGLLTFTFDTAPHSVNVRKRMGKLRDYVALSADWICYALIDDIVDCFAPVIRSLEEETDAIEDGMFTARTEDFRTVLKKIGDCRREVTSLNRLLGSKADVIKGFAKRCNEQYSMAPRQDVGMYLSDIQDHVVTMMNNLGHFEKILTRTHSNYIGQIQIDSIAQGSRANEVLSKITYIATILVPLNLVCSMFGMNVPVPGGKDGGSLAWWFGILGVILCAVLVATIIAKKKRLI